MKTSNNFLHNLQVKIMTKNERSCRRPFSKGTSCNGYNILDAINVNIGDDGIRIAPLVPELHTNREDTGVIMDSTAIIAKSKNSNT